MGGLRVAYSLKGKIQEVEHMWKEFEECQEKLKTDMGLAFSKMQLEMQDNKQKLNDAVQQLGSTCQELEPAKANVDEAKSSYLNLKIETESVKSNGDAE